MRNEQQEIEAYFIPDTIQLTSFTTRELESKQGKLILKYPVLSGEDIQCITETIKANQKNYLDKLQTTEVIDLVDAAVQKWLDPDYHWRQLAETWLPVITGYDAEMIRLELKRFLRTFRKKELLRFLVEEFDDPAVLDDFRPRKKGGLSKAYGPDLILHFFSGNVPGLPVWNLVMGLLVKSGQLGKTSSSEPLLPVLFAKSLEEVDPELAKTLAVLPWKGGEDQLEHPAIQAAEAVVAYGSSESVENIRKGVPAHKRFLSYGHKISFAMVGKEALTLDLCRESVHSLAEDVSVYDQQGCVSPQIIYVEQGGSVSPREFAQLLANEMDHYNRKKPRGPLLESEALAIQSFRSQHEFQIESSVYGHPDDTSWTVVYHPEPDFEPSPLNRTVHVFSCTHLEQVYPKLSSYRQYLQTAGVAVGPDRLFKLSEDLGKAGVSRVCAVGKMAQAPSGWHHDGQFNLLNLIRWTDIETSAEQHAEQYDEDSE
ncbi:acyl-CoA reductase [Halobacillus sp. A5]|uniref:acyl-CoA reductase n=1 Tax=Halobacillus sp. A5 TaxID=2880263 RepID=UPI0020A68EF1|nr:acyl-CoA reductase [Halobacillus sp. A5]MCP3027667.1 acyl-CoA reductase [Halobacillus sp. A5]